MTERQVIILSYLMNKRDWVISEELSEVIGVSKRTIQAEIKDLIKRKSGQCKIKVNQNRGYLLEFIDANLSAGIYESINNQGGLRHLSERPSSIILYLLFLKSHISLQKLADCFYMSKTTAASELRNIERWIERSEGLKLEISNHKGILIHASENRKRMYCSKFASIRTISLLPLPEEVKETYRNIYHDVDQVLSQVLLKHNRKISGEHYKKNIMFLSCSILRTQLGYVDDKHIDHGVTSELLNEIKKRIKDKLNYTLSSSEIITTEVLINESDLVETATIVPSKDAEECTQKLEDYLKSVLGLELFDGFGDSSVISQHFDAILKRNKTGNVTLNMHNEDIVLQFPLESYLSHCAFRKTLDFPVTKETSLLAVSIAMELANHRQKLKILMVSDLNQIGINSAKAIIARWGFDITDFTVIPDYLYRRLKFDHNAYDVLLTTNQETTLVDSEFIYIDFLDRDHEHRSLEKVFFEKITDNKERNIAMLRNKYVNEISIIGSFSGLNSVIGEVKDDCITYHTFAQTKVFVCRIQGETESQARIIKLKKPIKHLNKDISTIVYVSYNKNSSDDILLFFKMISQLLTSLS